MIITEAYRLASHPLLLSILISHIFLFYLTNLYEFRSPFTWRKACILSSEVFILNMLMIIVYGVVFESVYFLKMFYTPYVVVLLCWWRKKLFGKPFLLLRRKKIVILGTDKFTEKLLREMESYPVDIFEITAVFVFPGDDLGCFDSTNFSYKGRAVPVIRNQDEIEKIIFSKRNGYTVLYSLKPEQFPDNRDRYTNLILKAKFEGVDVIDVISFYKQIKLNIPIESITAEWFIYNQEILGNRSIIKLFIKRVVDICGALALLILFLPLFILISVLIKIDSPGPVLFIQTRVGLRKKEFRAIKFRSLHHRAEDPSGNPDIKNQSNSATVTRMGRFLRSSKFDELPQLLNILKGEMSFVGPRPVNKYTEEEMQAKIPFYSFKYYVTPGLTGWGQINYNGLRNDEAYIKRLEYDLFYIQNFSLLLDLIIILKTIKVSLTGYGSKLPDQTSEPYKKVAFLGTGTLVRKSDSSYANNLKKSHIEIKKDRIDTPPN